MGGRTYAETPGEGGVEEALISTQRDGQDPGTWNTSKAEDSGHGRAWRADVRTVKASGLWRDEERQTVPTGEPEGHPGRNLPHQCRAESNHPEVRPPEMLGNPEEVNRVEAKRKESPSVLPCNALGEEPISPSHQVTAWAVHKSGRDGTLCAKHHHCRLGWPDAKREAPLPTPSCSSVQSDLQIKLALGPGGIGTVIPWNVTFQPLVNVDIRVKGCFRETSDQTITQPEHVFHPQTQDRAHVSGTM